MLAAALVVIWTAASEVSTPGTGALSSAAGEALGPDTVLRVEAAPDPDGMRLSDVGNANAVVRLSWDEGEHRRARLLCYLRDSQRWVDREVVFEASDPERERGRTLGFLVASMLIEAAPSPSHPEAQAAPKPERAVVALPAATERRQPTKSVLAAGAEVATTAASSYGFWLGGEHAVSGRSLWFGGSVHARFGSIPEAQASSRLVGVGLHLGWLPVHTGPFALGARAGAGANLLLATHYPRVGPDVSETQGRFLPGGEILAQAHYRLGHSAGLTAQAGGEFLFGVTDVSVLGKEVASWPWAAILLRLGVEAAF